MIWQAAATARTSALPKRDGKSATEIHARLRFRLRLRRGGIRRTVWMRVLKTNYITVNNN